MRNLTELENRLEKIAIAIDDYEAELWEVQKSALTISNDTNMTLWQILANALGISVKMKSSIKKSRKVLAAVKRVSDALTDSDNPDSSE